MLLKWYSYKLLISIFLHKAKQLYADTFSVNDNKLYI